MRSINIESVLPLTPLQRGMLFERVLMPGASLYCEQLATILSGALDVDAFHDAWQHVVDRHDALRTFFAHRDRPKPVAIVRKQVDVPFSVEDGNFDWSQGSESLARILANDRARDLDLEQAPLMRIRLFRRRPDEHLFLWTHHHMILDGWSLGLVLAEVIASYQSRVQGRPRSLPPARSYRDYLGWLDRQPAGDAETYWRTLAVDTTLATPLRHGPVDPSRVGLLVRRVPPVLTQELSALARHAGTTLSTVLQGAWGLVLSRFQAASEVVFGLTLSGRPADLPGVEQMVGLFINTVPRRVTIERELDTRAWLQRLHGEALQLQQYGYASLSDIKRWASLGESEPFETLLVVENYPISPSLAAGDSLRVQQVQHRERTNYPLCVVAVPGEELELRFSYHESAMPVALVRRLAHGLVAALNALAKQPEGRIEDMHLLSAIEKAELVRLSKEPVRQPSHATIPAWILAAAEAKPDEVALSTVDTTVTYRELVGQATCVAGRLRERGVGRGAIVAVAMPRSPALVAVLLGVLLSGAAYVPVDTRYPAERIAVMLRESGASLTVSTQEFCGTLPEVVPILLAPDLIASDSHGRPRVDVRADDLAYVLYTSGSTGMPKGVEIEHAAAVHLIEWSKWAFSWKERNATLASTSVSFDLSIFEILVPLCLGSEVVLVDSLFDLPRVDHRHVTLVNTVPSVLSEYLNTNTIPASVQVVNLAGEPLPRKLVERIFQTETVRRVCNLYGPTEDTTYSTWVSLDPTFEGSVPIGRPVGPTTVHVVDEQLHPVPIGAPGEIVLGGNKLARGYRGRADLTRERFIPDPLSSGGHARLYRTGDLGRFGEDGMLYYIGRRDQQVKIRGQRIELGEIEATLARHPKVREAVVVANTRGSATRLVAFYVPASEDPGEDQLRALCSGALTPAMVPSHFLPMPSLPKTPNGKVDRRALASIPVAAPRTQDERPADDLERAVVDLWGAALKRTDLGRHFHFFEEGGDSLVALAVVARCPECLGTDVPVRTLFDAPTVAEFASAVKLLRTGSGRVSSSVDLERDAELGPSVRVTTQRRCASSGTPTAALLTGATGFLGGFVLRALLDAQPRPVRCLVRVSDGVGPLRRIEANLARLGLRSDDVGERVLPLVGDLESHNLGLSEEALRAAVADVGVVLHNGARVHMAQGYRELRAANVEATRVLLAGAASAGGVPVHFVSTTAVFDGQPQLGRLEEHSALALHEQSGVGYVQTKLVAEALVRAARSRGVPTTIYRPSAIVGDSRTGIANDDDFFQLMVEACVGVGAVPNLDVRLNIVPVDYVSRAIVAVVLQNPGGSEVYHLTDPKGVTAEQLRQWANSFGLGLRSVSAEAWFGLAEQWLAGFGKSHPFAAILPIVAASANDKTNRAIDSSLSRERLGQIGVAAPRVDQAAMHRYLEMKQGMLLRRPANSSAQPPPLGV